MVITTSDGKRFSLTVSNPDSTAKVDTVLVTFLGATLEEASSTAGWTSNLLKANVFFNALDGNEIEPGKEAAFQVRISDSKNVYLQVTLRFLNRDIDYKYIIQSKVEGGKLTESKRDMTTNELGQLESATRLLERLDRRAADLLLLMQLGKAHDGLKQLRVDDRLIATVQADAATGIRKAQNQVDVIITLDSSNVSSNNPHYFYVAMSTATTLHHEMIHASHHFLATLKGTDATDVSEESKSEFEALKSDWLEIEASYKTLSALISMKRALELNPLNDFNADGDMYPQTGQPRMGEDGASSPHVLLFDDDGDGKVDEDPLPQEKINLIRAVILNELERLTSLDYEKDAEHKLEKVAKFDTYDEQTATQIEIQDRLEHINRIDRREADISIQAKIIELEKLHQQRKQSKEGKPIGPPGGKTKNNNSPLAAVEIPPGALSWEETITIARLDESFVSPWVQSGELGPVSPPYDFGPDGMYFPLDKPVTITLSYEAGTDPNSIDIYWLDPAVPSSGWQKITADRTVDPVNRTISVKTHHFSTFIVSGVPYTGKNMLALLTLGLLTMFAGLLIFSQGRKQAR